MLTSSFSVKTPPKIAVSLKIAPVYNALMSISRLHQVINLTQPDQWLVMTANQMTAQELDHNRLIFEGLGDLLAPKNEYSNFTEYLINLEKQNPDDWYQGWLAEYSRQNHLTIEESAEIVETRSKFLAQFADSDQNFADELRELLLDPPALHQLIVSHLNNVWEKWLAAEWRKRLPTLQSLLIALQQQDLSESSAFELVRYFTMRDVPEIVQQLEGVEQLHFVLSPHVGPVAAKFDSPTALWVFLRAHPEELPLRRAPVKPKELAGPFLVLSDETRLKMLELLARHEVMLAQDIIAAMDITQSAASRHLKQLCNTGFVIERRAEGANKSYQLNPQRFDNLFNSLRRLLSEQAEPENDEARTSQPLSVRRFLDSQGRLTTYPAKRDDQFQVEDYLASRFEADREYTELEVNDILKRWHTYGDHSTLRRALYEDGFLDRTKDGTRYWLNKKF